MYYDFLQKNKRLIIAMTLLVLGIIIAWTIIILVSRIGKIPVTVSVVPSSAVILIDNQRVGNGTVWMTPGNHHISAEKSGFGSQKKTVTVSSEKTKNVTAMSLVAKSDEAKQWAKDNQKEYKDNEKYGAIEARAAGEYFTANNPITAKLPFKDPYYTIGYRVEKDQSVIISVITASPRYRFYAVEKIRDLGYEPTDFVIEFTDFRNPLEAK